MNLLAQIKTQVVTAQIVRLIQIPDKEIMDYGQNFNEDDKFFSGFEVDDLNSDRNESGLNQFKNVTTQSKPKGLQSQLNRIHEKIIKDYRQKEGQQLQNISDKQIVNNVYEDGTILQFSESVPYLQEFYKQLQIDT
ncbi:hypothetical protein pb186bvf_020393 [Paramecium bursaria]